MVRPVELKDSDGRLYVYACGKCYTIRNPMLNTKGSPPSPKAILYSLEAADECCLCKRCRQNEVGQSDKPLVWAGEVCEQCLPEQEAEEQDRQDRAELSAKKSQLALRRSLRKALDKDSALRLREVMSDISEDQYCASWLCDLEFILWSIVRGGRKLFGDGKLKKAELQSLKSLHKKANGWWYFDPQVGTQLFITTEEWQEMVKERKTENNSGGS